MEILTIGLIIFFGIDIVITSIHNHYKRIDNKLTKEQNKILYECYKLDAEIIRKDHELLTILKGINGGKINE